MDEYLTVDAFQKDGSILPSGEPVSDSTPNWWEAQNIPWQLVFELRRRNNSNNIGLYNNQNMSLNFRDNWYKYKGPMTPWVKLFSNGTGTRVNPSVPISKYLLGNDGEQTKRDGFLLEGGHGFYKGYGVSYSNNILNRSQQILGYDANGEPHVLNEHLSSGELASFYRLGNNKFSPAMLPPPGIVSINIQTPKDLMTVATINWKCYGLAQLEYMIPFFLTPRINVFLEFGWNLFNVSSLINYSNLDECKKLITHPETAISSYYNSLGNYGSIIGIIRKYDFTVTDGYIFDCKTEIISRQALYAGYKINTEIENKQSLTSFLIQNLPKVKDVVETNVKQKNSRDNSRDNSKEIEMDIGIQRKTIKTLIQMRKKILDDLNTIASPNVESGKYNENEDTTISYTAYYDEKLIRETEYYKTKIHLVESSPHLTGDALHEKIRHQMNTDIEMYVWYFEKQKECEKKINELLKSYSEIQGNFIRKINVEENGNITETKFYEDKFEDRFFINPTLFTTDDKSEYNKYINEIGGVYIPEQEKNSFPSENFASHGWVQLGFILELINYIVGIKGHKVEIDTIVTAHPNMISCDPNVLIPNSIAPKINIPQPLINQKDEFGNFVTINENTVEEEREAANKSRDAGVEVNSTDPTTLAPINENTFLKSQTKETRKLLQQGFTSTIPTPSTETGGKNLLEICQTVCSDTFLTSTENRNLLARDNIDIIVNHNYYFLGGRAPGTAAFPFNSEYEDTNSKTKYAPHVYGNLKYIYISVNKLISIAKELDGETETLEIYLQRILTTINDSVCGFWNLDIVNNGEGGGLKIVDKNLNLTRGMDIYQFEIGSTNSVIKELSFTVTLTNEQTTQILYSNGKNSINTESDVKEQNEKSSGTEIKHRHIPSLAYNDRLETNLHEEDSNNQEKKIIKRLPIYSDTLVASLQASTVHGETCIVKMHIEQPEEQTESQSSDKTEHLSYSSQVAKRNAKYRSEYSYVMLNFPPGLKQKLKRILYTPQQITIPTRNTDAAVVEGVDDGGYTGPADNFTITLKFDGIMGFRLFQYFSIANLPAPYTPDNVIFMVTEVSHQINNNTWQTEVTGMLRSSAGQGYNFITV